jgi:hypothetical protein
VSSKKPDKMIFYRRKRSFLPQKGSKITQKNSFFLSAEGG